MLIKVQDVFPYLTGEISPSLSSKDLLLLKDLIKQSVGIISSLVGYEIESHQKEEILDGSGTSTLYLNAFPQTLQTVKFGNNGDFSNSEILPLEDFILDDYKFSLIYKKGCFPRGNKNIYISYIAGWTSENLPSDLKSVLTYLTAQLFEKIRKKLTDVSYHAGLGSVVSFPAEKFLTSYHLNILDRYKLPL